MNIFFVGNTSALSSDFYDKFLPENRCVVYGKCKNLRRKKHIKVYEPEIVSDINDIYQSGNFDMTIYISKAIGGAVQLFDELENLEQNIYCSRKNRVKNFLVVASNDTKRELLQDTNKSRGRRLLLETGEKLLLTNASENMHVSLLRVPYLYSTSENKWQLENWFKDGIENKKITFRVPKETETTFLHDADLGELIARIADAPPSTNKFVANVEGGYSCSISELEENISRVIPGISFEYVEKDDEIPCVVADDTVEKHYSWKPKHKLADEFNVIAKNSEKAYKEKVRKKNKFAISQKFKSIVRITVETFVLTFIAEYLNAKIKNNISLQFMDFRLIAVLIIGTMNGMIPGLFAATLTSIGYLLTSGDKFSFQLILFDVINWLPFAAYFLLGAVTGYERDKHEDRIRNTREEYEVLEKKYSFLNNAYSEVLDSANRYNKQILGYQDSYGKIYQVVRHLDVQMPDRIAYESILSLENILGNNSVALYYIGENNNFARLVACSKSESGFLNKSVDLKRYSKCFEKFREGEMFINNESLKEYPAYAMPIAENGNIIGMITVEHAQNDEMSVEFANKMFIVSNLVNSFLVKALKDRADRSKYVGDTMILKHEEFAEVVKAHEKMYEKSFADYSLLKIENGEENLKDISEKLERIIRANDMLGLGKNGELYLLLMQSGLLGYKRVTNCMDEMGIKYEKARELSQ